MKCPVVFRGGLEPVLAVVFLSLLALAPAPAASSRNVLLVVADDLGADGLAFSNTNAAASLPPTPTLDALAARGVVFRQAYANPTCSPTRAALLTGRYGFRTGVTEVLDTPGVNGVWTNEFTLPEALAATHRCASIGKWHLGGNATGPNQAGGWPQFSGSTGGALGTGSGAYTSWTKVSNGVTRVGHTNYATKDNVDDALTWLAGQGTNRWFLWVAFNAPHSPFHKPPANLAPAYAGLSGTALDIQQNPRPYYEAAVQALDTELARLLAAIDTNQTTILFLGDNGTPARVIQPPFASPRGKDSLYEGGVRVPFLIAGPEVVNPGRVSDAVVHAVDVYATVLELSGVSASVRPSALAFDSRSLVPVLLNQPFAPAEDAVLMQNSGAQQEAQSGRAARRGRFKLIEFTGGTEEYYDLETDPLEATNLLTRVLTTEQSGALASLRARLDAWVNVPNVVTQHLATRFEAEVGWFANATLGLWRTPVLEPASWSRVTNAVVEDRGTVFRLSDPTPPSGQGWYRVRSD